MPSRIKKKLKDPNQIPAAAVAYSTEETTAIDRVNVSKVMPGMEKKVPK